MDKLIAGLLIAFSVIGLLLLFALLFAFITAYCWDNSIGEIFKLAPMTFWQAFCLNVLGGMVCKSSNLSSKKD